MTSCYPDNSELDNYPDYYQNYNKTQKLIDEGQLQESLALFKNIANSVSYVPASNYFTMAQIASKTGDCELTASYFTKAIENGYEYDKTLKMKERLNEKTFLEKYGFENCNQNIERIAKKQSDIQNQYFNQEYKKIIDSLFQKDQEIRLNEFDEKSIQIDSTNILTLLNLIKSYGYPNAKIVGHKTSSRAFIILLHFDKDYDNKILKPIIDNAYHSGFLSPTGLAWIVDRRRNWGPKQLDPYYFQIPAKVYDNYSIHAKEVVNARRDSIGLKPITSK